MVNLVPEYLQKLFLLYRPINHSHHLGSGPYCFSFGLFQGLLTNFPGLSFTSVNVIFQPGARVAFLNGLPDLISTF